MLNIFMTQVVLQGPGILTVIDQFETTRMS
jgi:hypothetical protein